MNIALIILHADPAKGGAERYTNDLAAALAARGHHVSLLASSFAGVPAGAEAVLLQARGISRLAQYLSFLDAVDHHLAARGYDIVHAMLPVRRCDLYHPHAGIAAEALVSGHEKHRGSATQAVSRAFNRINRKRREFARVERELLTGPNPPVVVCLSQYIKTALRRHYSVADDRIAVAFNGIDTAKFDPDARPKAGEALRQKLGIGPDRIMALMIAQDFERKGLSQAIAAMPKVDGDRLILVVAGKQDPGAYRRQAASLGVADRIIFAGPTNDPYEFYRAAAFFVLPTRHDPCSLVVLEALAMGLPVISTRQNGACEVITDGQEGFVLENPNDVDALAGAMRSMLDHALRDRMGHSCLDLRNRLSQDRHIRTLLSVYERMLAQRNQPAA